jgi:hypothetical protein
MSQRFKMTGFVFNIFIIMIQYIIIINSSDKINIMKQHIGKIDENKTNYNFEDRFDKFDNFVIKMVIKTVDYIHNKITEQPTLNPLLTNPPPTLNPLLTNPPPTLNHPPNINDQINKPTNNFNKISHLIPHYDNSDHNEILQNTWCPLCACKKSKSDLCTGISQIMYSLIINFEGVCSLCPTQYFIDVEEHIIMDSAFINKDLHYTRDSQFISLFDTNTQQNQIDCNNVFRQSFYKELKSSAIYTEMIGCINNPNSNYHINKYIAEVKSLFVIRWFWLKYENIFYKNRFQHYFFRYQHKHHLNLGDDWLKKILSNQALLFSIDGKTLNQYLD